MAFTLDRVVPWGRSLSEYRRMFALSDYDLDRKILGCADGPASVNAELYQRGKEYTSIDPIYWFSAQHIEERIEAATPVIVQQLKENHSNYVWDYYQSPEQLVKVRRRIMSVFLDDYKNNKPTERYVSGALPTLPFADRTFELVLCSYFLFTYAEQLDETFHQQAVWEMCRVGQEVRLFPLLEVSGQRSRHVDRVIRFLEKKQVQTDMITVDYEFQQGGNQLLRLITS